MADTTEAAGRVAYNEGGLALPEDLPYEDWVAVGAGLFHMAANHMFWLGDWWLFGERRYGEAAAAALPTGYALPTIQGAAWVASRFDPARRRPDLPFAHHKEVAALPAGQADALLEQAALESLPRDVLRRRVRRIRSGPGGGGLPAPMRVYVAASPGRGEHLADLLRQAGVDVPGGAAHRVGVMAECDACVLVLPADRAAHFDLGWFVGRGKRTAVLAPMVSVDADTAVYHHADLRTCSTDDLLDFFGLAAKNPAQPTSANL